MSDWEPDGSNHPQQAFENLMFVPYDSVVGKQLGSICASCEIKDARRCQSVNCDGGFFMTKQKFIVAQLIGRP